MKDTHAALRDSRGVFSRICAEAGGFAADKPHRFIPDKLMKMPIALLPRLRGYDGIGSFPSFQKLLFHFGADDLLKSRTIVGNGCGPITDPST